MMISTGRLSSWTALALLLATPAIAAPDPAAIRADVAALADDAMQGRALGSAEYDAAAALVAQRMAAAGLSPAGDGGGWQQRLSVIAARPAGGTLAVVRGGRRSVLTKRDWTRRAELRAQVAVQAPVVFAGFGVVDPAGGRDDLAGLDLRGKVVAVLDGAPAGWSGDRADYLAARDRKAQAAGAKGAVGIVTLEGGRERSFAGLARYAGEPAIGWAAPAGAPHVAVPGVPWLGMLSRAGAAKLFAGGPIDWRAVVAADRAGTAIPRGAVGATLAATLANDFGQIPTANVIGRLEGSDPTLKAEHVVLSAHLDHIGVGKPVAGDRIYNGAMDNAIGVATLLQVARDVARGPRPRRSILFAVVGAEETGLIGSDYLAQRPPVPAETIVANLNMDMPIMTYRFVDIVALGGERSTLGATVAAVARAHGLAAVPDPLPQEGFFTRTDHFSFVQRGVPSVTIDLGPGGPGMAATTDFLKRHYHQPSDDLSLPIDWESAARYAALNVDIVRAVADAPERPRWTKGDFFGLLYDGPGAR